MRKGFFSLLIAGCAIAVGVGLSLKPWHVYAQQKRSTNEQVAQMKRVQTERVQDLRKEAELGSAMGREVLARERGYRKIGEVASDKQ